MLRTRRGAVAVIGQQLRWWTRIIWRREQTLKLSLVAYWFQVEGRVILLPSRLRGYHINILSRHSLDYKEAGYQLGQGRDGVLNCPRRINEGSVRINWG